MNSTDLNSTVYRDSTRGWVPSSNDRGTIDILISCTITTFLCVWTCVCVNVPAPGRRTWDNFIDRWHMLCTGLAGPEFVLLLAMGQYCHAESSRLMFRQSHPSKGWTLRHSYFADMGAIHIRFPGWERTFPINGKQLHHLVTQKHIEFPSHITLELIRDKNKRDGLARSVCSRRLRTLTDCCAALSPPFRCCGSS